MHEITEHVDPEIEEARGRCLGSLLFFTQMFYKLRTGRDFTLSQPSGRESHFVTICRELTEVFKGNTKNLIINIPPRYGKTELVIHFVAWGLAHYPDANFIYTSYSSSLAGKQTQTIREIINLPYYRALFGVGVSEETSAKRDFATNYGGNVYAAGNSGSLTGRGCGVKGVTRFGGAFIIDDPIKPEEAASDVVREGVNDWYFNTAQSRVNSIQTPRVFIGQRTHEHDLAARLLETGDWKLLSIPAMDIANNALYPDMHTKEMLLKMQENEPYVYAAQMQQNPQPAGGGVFKPEWFLLKDFEPKIIATFITADTAETDKNYNDATVFSFWGMYKVEQAYIETDIYALHWIDCVELRIEPKDLYSEFMDFYAAAMRHSVKPKMIFIEKKSTGVTLLSMLKEVQGLRVVNIERNAFENGMTNSKNHRFLTMQSYVADKLISLPKYGRHTHMCIEHMRKITANNTHRFDDICDSAYDSIKVALIDKIVLSAIPSHDNDLKKANYIMANQLHAVDVRRRTYGSSRSS